MKKNILFASMLLAATALGFTACGDDDDPKPNPGTDPEVVEKGDGLKLTDEEQTTITAHYVDAIVTPTYTNLKAGNAALYEKVMAFVNNPTQANLNAACDEWIKARQPWETSEAFLFGPVADEDLDPSMDSWPLSVGDITQILNTGGEPNSEDNKGFHTLEYLLFLDGNARKIATDADYNRNPEGWRFYMEKVAGLLREDAAQLYYLWFESTDYQGSNYANYFKTVFANPVGQIIDGCNDIAGEVGESKIGEPYDLWNSGKTEDALYAVESWYSWHSREDYMNNINSIKNSYLGVLVEEGVDAATVTPDEASIATYVIKHLGKTYNEKFLEKLDAAYNAIDNIPQPFRNHINSAEAKAAMDACAELSEALEDLKADLGVN